MSPLLRPFDWSLREGLLPSEEKSTDHDAASKGCGERRDGIAFHFLAKHFVLMLEPILAALGILFHLIRDLASQIAHGFHDSLMGEMGGVFRQVAHVVDKDGTVERGITFLFGSAGFGMV